MDDIKMDIADVGQKVEPVTTGHKTDKSPLLSIIILSSGRFDLLSATINSLLASMTYEHFEIIVYNHKGDIGSGYNKLMESVKGEYVLNCQDDWFFTERWDWVQQSMKILKDKKYGIIRLRKDADGQHEEIKKETKGYGSEFKYYIVECVAGGFSLNPFLAKTEMLKSLGKAPGGKRGIAEGSLRTEYRNKGLLTAKLGKREHFRWSGVCVHIGKERRVGKATNK